MKLPKHFWIRVMHGTEQVTLLGSPADEKGFILVAHPANPEKKQGKLRIKVPAGAKLTRRGVRGGLQYHLPVLIGKARKEGELWWTKPEDPIDDEEPVEVVGARQGKV